MVLAEPVRGQTGAKKALKVKPVQITNKWVAALTAGGIDGRDGVVAGTINDPDADITDATTRIVKIEQAGTTLRARLKYDDGDTPDADPTIVVFGKTGDDTDGGSAWERLLNKAGATSAIMTTATTTDVRDGTDKYTEVSATVHAWDLNGCDEILVGVLVAYADAAGLPALAELQVKVI